MKTAIGARSVLVVGIVLLAAPGARAAEPLVTNWGIGNILHPIQEPASVPGGGCPKDHVYIFAINGVNPLCQGNFNGFCSYFRKQGYCHTYFGQMYTCLGWADRIREVRRCDPEAKIVVVGFSAGANLAKMLVNNLARDCTRVDLLVYLVGDMLTKSPSTYPPNVGRVLNIRAIGLVLTGGDLFFNGVDIPGARNCRIECRHILVPSRCETLTLVSEELAALACGTCATPAQPAPEALPVPAAQPAPVVEPIPPGKE